jgi:hypothetical protein
LDISNEKSTDGILQPEDKAILEAIERSSSWFRAVLCTLARRGVAFRQQHSERAHGILDALSTSPFYKSGQFLFDLMELEDFMLDETPPEIVDTVLDATALNRLAVLLNSIKGHLDGALEPQMPDSSSFEVFSQVVVPEDLPPLKPSFYLYQDVILGLVRTSELHLALQRATSPG